VRREPDVLKILQMGFTSGACGGLPLLPALQKFA